MTKIALVTGAAKGIGRACAQKLAEAGFRVAVHYRNSEIEAKALAQSIGADAMQADLRSGAEADALVDRILEKYGRIDVVINNAGLSSVRQVQDISEDEWDLMMQANAKSCFLVTRAVLPAMIEAKSGSIVNISSMWGIAGASCESAYSASKGAVIAFTRAVAKEVAPSRIRVNCIAPGVIRTSMLDGFSDKELAGLAENTPLARLGTPRDVAEAAAFFASDAASFITGQVLCVDGGFIL